MKKMIQSSYTVLLLILMSPAVSMAKPATSSDMNNNSITELIKIEQRINKAYPDLKLRIKPFASADQYDETKLELTALEGFLSEVGIEKLDFKSLEHLVCTHPGCM